MNAFKGANQEMAESHQTLIALTKETMMSTKTDEINTFPGSREYLGTITVALGKSFKVYMPLVIDYANLDFRKQESQYRLAAKSLGISYLAFQVWSFPDAQLVMNMLSKAIETFCPVGDKK